MIPAAPGIHREGELARLRQQVPAHVEELGVFVVLAATIGSSLIQPTFGLVSDRVCQPWLMPFGVLVAGAGLALAGPAPSYGWTVAAIAVSGLGVAAFHPEGAQFAGVAAGERREPETGARAGVRRAA